MRFPNISGKLNGKAIIEPIGVIEERKKLACTLQILFLQEQLFVMILLCGNG